MKVLSITVANVKGCANLRLEPKTLTVISGPNGSGKTSVLDAISAVFAGGHDPSLIRTGAESAVITVQTDRFQLKRTITQKASKLTITTEDGGVVGRPETLVKSLCSKFAFDPMRFLDAPGKDRLEYLQRVLPITFDFPEVSKAVGHDNVRASYTLDELNALRKGLYDSRTEFTRAFKQTDATANHLRQALSGADQIDWAAEVLDKRAALATAEASIAEGISQLEARAEAKRAIIVRAREETIAELQAQIERTKEEARLALDDVGLDLMHARDAVRMEASGGLDQIKHELSVAESRLADTRQREGALAQIGELDKIRVTQGGEVDRLTRAIEALDALKRSKLDQIPIQGLEVVDGEIYIGGIRFDQLNLQTQIFVAMEIGALSMGELPLVLLDDFEHVDSKRFELFLEAVRESGWQVITARVSDREDLTVQNVA